MAAMRPGATPGLTPKRRPPPADSERLTNIVLRKKRVRRSTG
jgi:hypothetical protein